MKFFKKFQDCGMFKILPMAVVVESKGVGGDRVKINFRASVVIFHQIDSTLF